MKCGSCIKSHKMVRVGSMGADCELEERTVLLICLFCITGVAGTLDSQLSQTQSELK